MARAAWFATSLSNRELFQKASAPQRALFHLEGTEIGTALEFLAALGEQLKVADLAQSEDWDYLGECLVDLDEFATEESFVISFDRFHRLAQSEPRKWESILSVFGDAVEQGRERNKPMYIFLGGEPFAPGFPFLTL